MIGCNNEHEEEICQYTNESSWYFENMKCVQRKSTVFNNGDQNKSECFPLLFSMFNKSWEILQNHRLKQNVFFYLLFLPI
jgi:hypothetical protein